MRGIMEKIVFVVLISLVLFSCDLFGINGGTPNGGETNFNSKGNTFWATDFTDNSYYLITAEMLAQNEFCEIWVEKGCGVNSSTATTIANTYKNIVYKRMMEYLGWSYYDTNLMRYVTVMEYADFLGNEDGKLTILILDIRDGYEPDGAYVGGYFWSGDFFTEADGSNKRDIIYLDSYPTLVGSDDFYETLAHEMQHMMNFISTIAFRTVIDEHTNEIKKINYTDTWIDEGLSSISEWIYSGTPSQSRVNWYNNDSTGLIAKGDNFYIWDESNSFKVLNDYATVNIFFQYLRLQSNQNLLFKILISEHNDYRAITNSYNITWSKLLADWFSANYNPIIGYKNDSVLKNIKVNFINSNAASTSLYPGEGVYSINPSTIPSNSGTINYLNLNSSKALLTYNIDTNYNNSPKPGTISGNLPPNAQISDDNSRSVKISAHGYQIGARDMLNRNVNNQNRFNTSLSELNINSSRSSNNTKKSLPLITRENIKPYYELMNE